MKYLRGSLIDQKEIADDFYEAYIRCIKTDENKKFYLIPGFVNGLFACEIYLKYILKNNGVNVSNNRSHSLYTLFNKLTNGQKHVLESVDCNLKYNLKDLLKKIGNGFVLWRYVFEDGNEDFADGRPLEFTDYFLKTYLPAIKAMATKQYEEKKLKK